MTPAQPAGWRARLGGLLLALTDIYTVPVAAYVFLRLLTGWRLWPIAFLGNLIHLILLPALPLALLLIALKRWRRASIAAVGALAFLWWFGAFFVPNIPAACPEPCQSLTVLQFNIADGRWPSDTLIAAIRASNADLVTLEEVSPDQAAQMQSSLSDLYPYQVLNIDGGAGLLSRHPIHFSERLMLPGRSYLRANIAVNDQFVVVLVAHPQVSELRMNPPDYVSVSRDAFITLTEIASQGEPTILAGDFNMIDQSADYDLLRHAGFRDAFRDAGWGFGWTYAARGAVPPMPSAIPLLRIDFIMHTDHFRAVRSWVGPDYGSDHLPLWAELVWTTPDS
jgi:vancomycin resistance protein VanJ